MTIYMKIVYDFKKDIQSKKYKPNEKLPTEQEIAKKYNCSRGTVKTAINMLKSEGLVYQRKGSGTYVTGSHSNLAQSAIIDQFLGLSKTEVGRDVKSKIFNFEIVEASEKVAKNLQINPGDYIYYIERGRLIDNQPYCIEHTYMPVSVIPNLKRKHLETSVYHYIEHNLKYTISSSDRVITSRLPNTMETDFFNSNNITILNVEQTCKLKDGPIFEYAEIAYNGNESNVKMRIERNKD